jgi:4-amino-4-deoxy-L-arabinose transferase-like glycosyltransferase
LPSPLLHRERLILVVILVVGAWLRFQHIGDIEYNIDQAYPIWQALKTLDTGVLPLVGQGTSVLFANPPLTGYLLLPALALLREPIAAYMVTLMLNTLAIWLVYRGLRWLIGTRLALVGTALFAVNPWIIEDSRRTWVQSLAPFFVCLIFWALVPVLTGQTRHPQRRVLIATVGLAIFAHTYLLAYALVAPVGLLLLLYWRRVPRRPLVIGGAVFAVLTLLYGIGLARQWDDTSQRAEQFSSGQARLSAEALNHALRLVTGAGYTTVRGGTAPANDADLRADLSAVLQVIWAAAIATGGALALIRLWQSRSPESAPGRDVAIVLGVWFVLPILMMSYVSQVVHPFYLLLTVPAGYGLAALGIAPLLRYRIGVISVLALVMVTGTVNGLNTIRFAQDTAAHPGEDLPTLPLRESEALGRRIHAALTPGMALIAPMDEWTQVTLAGRVLRVERLDNLDRSTVIPRDGGLYITMQRDPAAPFTPPLVAQPVAEPLVLGDGAIITLWRAQQSDVTIDHPADFPSDIDVRFAGWTLDGDVLPGAVVTLDTYWRVDALHADRGVWTFAPYAHLYDGSGARIVIADSTDISALTWAAGDLLVYRLVLAVPQESFGPYAVNVGLYDSVRALNAVFHLTGDVYAADIPIIAPNQAP